MTGHDPATNIQKCDLDLEGQEMLMTILTLVTFKSKIEDGHLRIDKRLSYRKVLNKRAGRGGKKRTLNLVRFQ